LHRALEAATERRQHIATLEHLLLALTEDPNAIGMMNAAGLDVASTREWLARSADDAAPREAGYVPEPTPSEAFQRVVQRAIHDAQASGERPTTGAHVLLAIMLEHDSTAVRILWMEGLDLAVARKSARQG
jgi:ATP-dependent Clp protease ATP-binding subunit ClpA